MKFFGLGGTRDPLLERAETLVPFAQTVAVGMFSPFLQRFPILSQVNIDDWDFFLTVAGVFMAASRLNNLKVGDAREEALMEVVAAKLDAWNPNGARAFIDCKDLFEREYDRLGAGGDEPEFLAADALGSWIVWNVLRRAADTDEEWMLARASGASVTHVFFQWWDAR